MLVLGSQKLTELRDSICCVSDLQIGGEFSNTPDQAPEHISKVRWSDFSYLIRKYNTLTFIVITVIATLFYVFVY